jgi:hypothetical protein
VARKPDGGFGTVPRPHLLTPRLQALLNSGDFVITPGGPRRKELVHVIQPGEAVTREQGVLRKVDSQGTTIDLPEARVSPEELPALGSGWITNAAGTYAGDQPISSFSTTWVVPPEPAASDSQLIYLFNGLQDSPVTHILQPVLQWGVSSDGGGAFWAVASWFVDSSGNAFKTSLVKVNVGDTLTGVMTLTGQSGSNFSYRCEFAGLDGTALQVMNINQLVMVPALVPAGGPGFRRWLHHSAAVHRHMPVAVSGSYRPVRDRPGRRDIQHVLGCQWRPVQPLVPHLSHDRGGAAMRRETSAAGLSARDVMRIFRRRNALS